jgi:hypothetical protein
MDLHPCPQCGDLAVAWREALVDRDGVLARRYAGACERCGADREFLFGLPDRPTPPQPGAPVTFGPHDEPSVLLDAGEWLLVADFCAEAAGATSGAAARESLDVAVAALAEVLKFVPADADEPPPTAFWTDRGRAEHARSPGRFRRDRLAVVQDSYASARAALRVT